MGAREGRGEGDRRRRKTGRREEQDGSRAKDAACLPVPWAQSFSRHDLRAAPGETFPMEFLPAVWPRLLHLPQAWKWQCLAVSIPRCDEGP